ncbi:MAG TPA: glutaredoxin domain-containing protein [Chloroflexota bacterium]|nr:glutaredoxin domain-containing protein [Chloroflexota bacterium]
MKDFLSQRGVRYTLKDLNVDAEARDEFVRSGYLLPPVVVVDGDAVVGFDPARLDQLLDRGERSRGTA